MNHAPRDEKQQEQHDQRVAVGRDAVEVELEVSEQGPDPDALEPVGATGQPGSAVCRLVQQQPDAQRNHDQGEVPEAGDDETGGVTDDACGGRGEHESRERLAPAVLGNDPGRIGADPEKGGMP